MNRLLLAIPASALLLAGCSVNRIAEGYSPDGNLLTRTWNSHQFGTVRQARMSMEQVDGAYNINAGENVAVDPNVTAMVQQAAITAMTITGMSSLRRATPDSAFGPVSVDSIGAGGLGSSPITAEQQAAMAARDARIVELARIRAEAERLQEELAAAQAERDAARGALEEATRPRPEPAPQPSPNAPGVANREVTP